MTVATITPSLMRELLRYEPESGRLYWLPRGVDWFNDGKISKQHACKSWNTRYAGAEAFTARTRRGYLNGKILNTPLLAHRVAYTIYHGVDIGDRAVDHIDGDTSNNRISNLRLVTSSENAKNAARQTNNKSGINGVRWCKSHGTWVAQIGGPSKRKHLGSFATKLEAAAARKAAEIHYGYHENHGRKALGG